MRAISVVMTNNLIYQFCKAGHRRFKQALTDVEAVQRKKLADLLAYAERTEFGRNRHLKKEMTWETFHQALPVTHYKDWEDMILRQKKSGEPVLSGDKCARYQPTSGSTS